MIIAALMASSFGFSFLLPVIVDPCPLLAGNFN
jgi:hypothetical protein